MADENTSSDEKDDEQPEAPKRKVNTAVAGGIVGLVIILAVGIFFSFQFVESERQRALQEWQIKLGIVADSRVADINEWVALNFDAVAELTENQSLQLYLTELDDSQGDQAQVTDGAAQAGYLRNYLVAHADRNGFSPPPPVQETNSNVERAGEAGMALTDANGVPFVVTPEMPPIAGKLRSAAAKALEGEPAVVDMYLGATNRPTIGFALPVYGIQDTGTKGIGVAFGLRVLDEELWELLDQPGDTSKTAETYLVRKGANTVEYLSPLRDGTAPLKRKIALDTADLAAAFAIEKPGGFAIKRNYAGEEVLVTSRAIADLPWVLVRSITREEALAANESRLQTILVVFVLIIIGVAVAMIAVWRHGTSLRAAAAAEKFRISSERFENMSKFMRVVTNSQPTAIVAVDGTTTYTFANEPAGKDAGVTPEDMMGKKMASVMGPVKAKTYAELNKDLLAEFARAEEEGMEDSVRKTRKSYVREFESESGDIEVIKSDHIPLRGDRDHPPGILMILDDITEFSLERLKSEARLRQLVGTLVNVVDRRDPDGSTRSNSVAEVARALAEELEREKVDIDTVEFAGNLRGLGNIFVPTETLAKTPSELSAEEQKNLETSYQTSADLLESVDFEGPVVETIRHSGESWDGSGPLGIAGEDILLTGRIVAVAESFVGLVTPDGGQPGLSFEDATVQLLQEAGKKFDRKVVTALMNHIDNHGGAEKWSHFRT